jgi:hypothetical protein
MNPSIDRGPFWRTWFWPSKKQIDHHLDVLRGNLFDLSREFERARLESILYNSIEVEKLYRTVLGHIQIKSVTGYKKIRLGRKSDGGYVMIDNLDGIAAAYSLGIFDEISWDLEMANRGIPIIQYDFSVDGPPIAHKNFTFYRKRIASSRNLELGHESVEGIVDGHHHQGKKLILKMDIEGSEWEVLDTMKEETLMLFDQILIEAHDFRRIPEYEFRERVIRVLKKLNLHHTPVHVHANNCARVFKLVDFFLSDVLELSYVRSKDYSLTECNEIFPGPCDYPNNANSPEIYLGNFKFD